MLYIAFCIFQNEINLKPVDYCLICVSNLHHFIIQEQVVDFPKPERSFCLSLIWTKQYKLIVFDKKLSFGPKTEEAVGRL
jgi:hypothetical protein